jgi:hypothetical protein
MTIGFDAALEPHHAGTVDERTRDLLDREGLRPPT